MGRRVRTCRKHGCDEPRERYSTYGYCSTHDAEAESEARESYSQSPRGQAETELEECETLEDVKHFLSERLLPLLSDS